MDDYIYQTLRSASLKVLQPHLDALLAQHEPPDANQIAGRKTTFLRYEREQAIALLRARLPSEKERSAVRLLAAAVKHRALVWWCERPNPKKDGMPLPPLGRTRLESFEKRTLAAVEQFARHLPKLEAEYLVECGTGTWHQAAVAAAMGQMGVAEPAPEPDAMLRIGWYDETMDAAHWFAMKAVEPEGAAMLLCRCNPNTETLAAAEQSTNDETGPRELVQLRQRFEDISRTEPGHRALVDWLRIAREMGLRYHSWIEQYVGDAGIPVAVSKPSPTTGAEPAPASEPAEGPKDRRARLLSWFEDEKNARGDRGAVQRVTAREKQRRSTADRGNIGKDIRKAREERAEQLRANAMFGQLGN